MRRKNTNETLLDGINPEVFGEAVTHKSKKYLFHGNVISNETALQLGHGENEIDSIPWKDHELCFLIFRKLKNVDHVNI